MLNNRVPHSWTSEVDVEEFSTNSALMLPGTVIKMIGQFLGTHDRNNFCLVNKTWLPAATEILWSEPIFKTPESFHSFVRAIKNSKHCADRVRELDLCAPEESDDVFAPVLKSLCKEHQMMKTYVLSKPHLITWLIRSCENLQSVRFYGWNLHDKHIHSFHQYCKKLKEFRVVGNENLTQAAIYSIINSASELRVLDLDGKFDLPDSFAETLARKSQFITSLKLHTETMTASGFDILAGKLTRLKELTLQFCPGVTDTNVARFVKNNPQLQILLLSGENLTIQSLRYILHNSQKLRNLDLRCPSWFREPPRISKSPTPPEQELCVITLENIAVDDDTINKISLNCPKLEIFGLFRCSLVTDQSINFISHNSRNLRIVNAFECPNITSRCLKYLANTSITQFIVESCGTFAPEGVQWFARTATKLEKLTFHGTPSIINSFVFQFSNEWKPGNQHGSVRCTIEGENLKKLVQYRNGQNPVHNEDISNTENLENISKSKLHELATELVISVDILERAIKKVFNKDSSDPKNNCTLSSIKREAHREPSSTSIIQKTHCGWSSINVKLPILHIKSSFESDEQISVQNNKQVVDHPRAVQPIATVSVITPTLEQNEKLSSSESDHSGDDYTEWKISSQNIDSGDLGGWEEMESKGNKYNEENEDQYRKDYWVDEHCETSSMASKDLNDQETILKDDDYSSEETKEQNSGRYYWNDDYWESSSITSRDEGNNTNQQIPKYFRADDHWESSSSISANYYNKDEKNGEYDLDRESSSTISRDERGEDYQSHQTRKSQWIDDHWESSSSNDDNQIYKVNESSKQEQQFQQTRKFYWVDGHWETSSMESSEHYEEMPEGKIYEITDEEQDVINYERKLIKNVPENNGQIESPEVIDDTEPKEDLGAWGKMNVNNDSAWGDNKNWLPDTIEVKTKEPENSTPTTPTTPTWESNDTNEYWSPTQIQDAKSPIYFQNKSIPVVTNEMDDTEGWGSPPPNPIPWSDERQGYCVELIEEQKETTFWSVQNGNWVNVSEETRISEKKTIEMNSNGHNNFRQTTIQHTGKWDEIIKEQRNNRDFKNSKNGNISIDLTDSPEENNSDNNNSNAEFMNVDGPRGRIGSPKWVSENEWRKEGKDLINFDIPEISDSKSSSDDSEEPSSTPTNKEGNSRIYDKTVNNLDWDNFPHEINIDLTEQKEKPFQNTEDLLIDFDSDPVTNYINNSDSVPSFSKEIAELNDVFSQLPMSSTTPNLLSFDENVTDNQLNVVVPEYPISMELVSKDNKQSSENLHATNENKNKSFKSKLSFLFTKEFLKIFLLGQFLSLCITISIVTSTELFNRGASYPTTQSALTYISLFLVYTPITLYKIGFKGYVNMLKTRAWKYILLSIVDVEGNYFIVKAFSYTSTLSILLLDAWTIFIVVILGIFFLKTGFHWSQYLGVAVCLASIGVIIAGDFDAGTDMFTANKRVLGDIFCLISATLYGISNTVEEYCVRKRPFYEVVGQMGFWGIIISIIQISILERKELETAHWDGPIVGLVLTFTFVMFCLYTAAPILFQRASAIYFNISLLTSDFYTLILTMIFFKFGMKRLYPLGFVLNVIGLAAYYIYPATQPNITQEGDEFDKRKKTNVNNENIEKDVELSLENIE
ncbi:11749_t:CDS:2 [Diversispora eburnea]|uniref:11749_t:CDS:1 n=1 Tax=Diversispora eburnea TaxID=1213867 RepID=A0A9N9BLB1_9GLOM|nr:11749_t:CDS:2 [Diversispora eburnea]